MLRIIFDEGFPPHRRGTVPFSIPTFRNNSFSFLFTQGLTVTYKCARVDKIFHTSFWIKHIFILFILISRMLNLFEMETTGKMKHW